MILDRKFYDNAIQEIISDICKFEKLYEDLTLKREASLQHLLRKLKQKTFLTKLNMIIFILLVLLLLVSMILLKRTNSPLMMHFLNFIQLSTSSSIVTFNYNLARFLCDLFSPLVPNDYSCKDTFSFVS